MHKEDIFISALLTAKSEEQSEFISKGVNAGVFAVRSREVSWIIDYYQTRGRFPSLSLYNSKFGKTKKLKKVNESVSGALQEVIDAHVFAELCKNNENIQRAIDENRSMKEVISLHKKLANEISDFNVDYVDIDLNKSYGAEDRYKKLVSDFSKGEQNFLDTPWPTLNRVISYFRIKETAVLTARPSIGKAQPLDSNILSEDGFVKMRDIYVGKVIRAADGSLQKVNGVFPQGTKSVYRVEFNDGTSTLCCKEHLWSVSHRRDKKKGDYSFKPVELSDIMLKVKDVDRLLWEVPQYQGHDNKEAILPASPYLVGVFLGDGTLIREVVLTNSKKDIREKIKSLLPESDELVKDSKNNEGSYRVKRKVKRSQCPSETLRIFRELGLHGVRSDTKFIPEEYLLGSKEQRIELLRGLMDTDGEVVSEGKSFSFCTTSERMAKQFRHLVLSLGASYVTFKSFRKTYSYKEMLCQGKISYTVSFRFFNQIVPFYCSAKKSKVKVATKQYRKMIKSVEYAGEKECQCISVTSKDNCYVTDDYIVTHNTWIALALANHYASKGIDTLFLSLEMSKEAIEDRVECIRYKLPYELFRKGDLSPKEVAKYRKQKSKQNNESYPFIVSSDSNMLSPTGMEMIETKVREYNPKVVIVDGAYKFYPSDLPKNANDVMRFSRISAFMNAVSKRYSCFVVPVIQQNRESEKSKSAKGKLGNIYGADAWAQDADWVFDIGGMRGGRSREIELLKGRESALVEYKINFSLFPYPDFSELVGSVSEKDNVSGGDFKVV